MIEIDGILCLQMQEPTLTCLCTEIWRKKKNYNDTNSYLQCKYLFTQIYTSEDFGTKEQEAQLSQCYSLASARHKLASN